ncbi:hypothetical protein DFH09DRAFT_1074365 [Mycena vulgaris]|nr:hypothetical protein DFH09DRAFT_1074365 [Mycena vulgaris]
MGKKANKQKKTLKARQEASQAGEPSNNDSSLGAGADLPITTRSLLITAERSPGSWTSNHGVRDSHGVSTHGPNERSSPLPPLTPSDNGQSPGNARPMARMNTTTVVSESFESDLAERVPQSTRVESTRIHVDAGNPSNGRKATIEEVSDEGSTRIATQSQRSVQSALREGNRESVERQNAQPSSSPYPVSNVSQVYGGHNGGDSETPSSMTDARRAERRQEKQRRNHADSIESAELRLAAAQSMAEVQPLADNEERPRPNQWDAQALRTAYAALNRERELHDNSEEFKQRRAAWERMERNLKGMRVEEDHELAVDMAVQDALEAADRAYAEELNREERPAHRESLSNDMEREEAEASALEGLAAAKRAAIQTRRHSQARGSAESGYQNKDDDHSRHTRATSNAKAGKPLPAPTNIHNRQKDSTTSARSAHEWYDRIVLQRYRLAELKNGGSSRIKDQGIDWDKEGQSFEVRAPPSRGSSIGTLGGKPVRPAQFTPHDVRESTNDESRSNVQSTRNGHVSRAAVTPITMSPRDSGRTSGTSHRSAPTKTPSPRTQPVPTPIKEDKSSGFYSRGGTKPASTGHRDWSRNHHDPSSDPSSSDQTDSSSDSSSETDSHRHRDSSSASSSSHSRDSSEDSDLTYQPEDAYSRSEDTDSAWDENPSEIISEITQAVRSGASEQNYTRSGRLYTGGMGWGEPSDSSSSSSEEEHRRPSTSRKPKKKKKSESRKKESQIKSEAHEEKDETQGRNSRDVPRMAGVRREDIQKKVFRMVRRESVKPADAPRQNEDPAPRPYNSRPV